MPTNRTALTDLGSAKYLGFAGGLYPNGKNSPPSPYQDAGIRSGSAVEPVDRDGKPSTSGKIVLLSIGMSNASQEFTEFIRLTGSHPQKNRSLVLIDAARDGRVVGFGNTDPRGSEGYGIKRQVDVPIASPSCEGTLDGQNDEARYRCHAGFEFVAGKPLLAKDSCTGDSGGPFYVEGRDGWLLAGATSRATNAAPNDCGDGGVYVRIERYLPWIRQLPGIALE